MGRNEDDDDEDDDDDDGDHATLDRYLLLALRQAGANLHERLEHATDFAVVQAPSQPRTALPPVQRQAHVAHTGVQQASRHHLAYVAQVAKELLVGVEVVHVVEDSVTACTC
jgi:hypothetical protein